jgi:acyl dehydratase
MPSKEMIGRTLSTGSATVTAEHVAGFARALGDLNPLYLDAEAARRGPFGGVVAPPTYPIAFMTEALSGGMETFLELGLDFMTLVHGEQEFEYVRPVKIGETLELTGRIADIYEKTNSAGATLDFVVMETEGKDTAGKPVFYSRNVLISKRM